METNIKKLIEEIPHIIGDSSVGTIIELGARDCVNTIIFNTVFQTARIYAFECNPATLPTCRINVAHLNRVKLIEKSVTDKNGRIVFYPVDQAKSEKTVWSDGNPGASSIYKIIKENNEEKIIQKKISVPTIQLSGFIKKERIKCIDLLFMDIQGSELLAIKGLGQSITKVKIIHTEACFLQMYRGQPLFIDIKIYLNLNGFYLYSVTSFAGPFADFIFVNQKYTNIKYLKIRDNVLTFIYSKLLYTVYRKIISFRFYNSIKRYLYIILAIFGITS